MANIAAVQVDNGEHQSIEALIQEQQPDFAFVEDTIYQIQTRGAALICPKTDRPSKLEGFSYPFPFEYKHASGLSLWARSNSPNSKVIVNVGD